ncbi:MAG TPA: LLM class flavin-dependent oxidoreductase [Candidatus Binataceae bacterium]|nr:LLM class flavin-dependent oxidoreductase [Candidatus Binataceae bacterium]
MSDALPLDNRLRFGVMTQASDGDQARRMIKNYVDWGYEALWIGDHIAFQGPINDPLTQIAFFAALAPKMIFGTCVYLVPLRHPTATAKMVATLDRLLGPGRLIFGIGVGGEFPPEFEASGVPVKQRGGRTNESLPLMRRLWTEPKVAHQGKYFKFGEIRLEPKPLTPGGPPIWVGGRGESALKRAAILGDGWMPYVVSAKRISEGLDFIGAQAAKHGRKIERFGTGVLLFCLIDDSYERALDLATESLSKRYGMDFREPARRYGALGRPADIAARMSEFIKAGVRDFSIDVIGTGEARNVQLERFAREVIPMLKIE